MFVSLRQAEINVSQRHIPERKNDGYGTDGISKSVSR